jgi:hypothetical protein
MGNLQENPSSITSVGISSLRAAMGEVLQHLKALAHDVMGLLPFDVDDKPNPAGILFVLRIIEPLLARQPG